MSASRMVMFSGSTRASRNASRPDTTPMLTCGSKNVESSDAITMSDGRHEVEARRRRRCR